MTIQEKKLNLINRLRELKSESLLDKIEEVIISEELENNAQESEKDIEEGNVVSLDQFKTEKEEWIKNNTIK